MTDKAFCVVGGGTMGQTFTRALISNGLAQPGAITICEIADARRASLAAELGVVTTADPVEAAKDAPVVFMAVKPQDFPSLGQTLQGLILPQQLVISIMAGVAIHALRDHLGHRAVVRAMPNTPAQIGQGLTAWTAPPEVSESQRAQVAEMLQTLGQQIYVPDERHIDMATAVSGSGPGFLFLILEAMIDGAVQIGMRRDLASELVLQTALGSAAYAQESGLHPALLRDMVTSPGGTTAEGLRAMEQNGVRAGMMEAIIAAYRRTQELGDS
ncbi:MAG: pyrroline-5-carboxylate reductase [Chloroflexi bacterium]|nr:MAG: pyrroline-5-carboxylate reductase [Chloroflexota bacterium]